MFSPYYAQSNGKFERWRHTLKVTVLRPSGPSAPQSLDEALRLMERFVEYRNSIQSLHCDYPSECIDQRSHELPLR